MNRNHSSEEVLADWSGILGESARASGDFPGRDLWRVTAEDRRQYFLKRYGPWRNLPLADEARILRFLSAEGVSAAELLPTDRATLFAGAPEESFVLFPQLENNELCAAEVLASEHAIGIAIAKLHRALARYPWQARSYSEGLTGSLERDLMLPPAVAHIFDVRRQTMITAIQNLPVQLIHGDMTPGNVLLRRRRDVSGFIDFDHLPMGPRIWDIGKYLSRRLRMGWRRNDFSATYGRADHILPFLRGYQSESPLLPEELAALPALITAGNVIETSYFMEISAGKFQRRVLPDHDEVLDDSIEAAYWHLSHWDQVMDAVESAIET